MSDIFISYKREEQPVARRLAEALEKKGWSVWWDPNLRGGEYFDEVIERALKETKCVIVLWSQLSVESRHVKDEATYALNQDKLVPVAIDEVAPQALPFRFQGIHTPQLLKWDGLEERPEFQTLLSDIVAILGPAPIDAEAEAKRKEEEEQRRAEAEAEGGDEATQVETKQREPPEGDAMAQGEVVSAVTTGRDVHVTESTPTRWAKWMWPLVAVIVVALIDRPVVLSGGDEVGHRIP